MARDEDLTLGADRVSADVLRTTGSILRFRLGDASDFRSPNPPGSIEVITVAMGSVTSDDAKSFLVPDDDEPRPVIWIELDGETVDGVGACWPDSEELLAVFVDQVQDAVIEARWEQGVSPAAWPECRIHHSHPLEAVVQDRVAVWVCPIQPSSRYPIGSLP